MSDLDSEIQAAEQQARDTEKAVGARIQRQQADDRSLIAKIIIYAFVVTVGVVVLAVCAGTYYLTWEKIAEPGKILVSILGSVLLPVVTLVIGYYFSNK